jgi:exopolyphosphatase/guanosine-5'-triphosphate,3'-diphosphate pyrophosphatase
MPEDLSSGSVGVSDSGDPKRRRKAGRRNKARKAECYGVIDLGTNNCRLLIARSMANGFKVVDSYSKVVRLGAGLARTGKLADANMDAAVEAIQVCAQKMKSKSVKRWRCIATQACRQAENGDEFLTRVKAETGLSFETISPRVEARLSVMGCMNIIDEEKDVALVIDIGGGSTELSWVDVRRMRDKNTPRRLHRPPISAWASLPIGVVNLSEIHPEGEADQDTWFSAMKDHVRAEIDKQNCQTRFANTFKEGRGHLVGTSGTITSLASVHMRLPFYQRNKIDGIWMASNDVIATARHLSEISLEARQKVPCIGEDRAGMLVAGCAILDVVCELWPSDRIRIADRGLREGMLMGLMNKTQIRHSSEGSRSKEPKGKDNGLGSPQADGEHSHDG